MTRTAARLLAVVALATPAVAALAVTGPSALAAASGVTSPAAGAVITSGSSIDVRANVAQCSLTCSTYTLTVSGPGGYSKSGNLGQSLTGDATLTVVVPTGTGQSVSNGGWTAALTQGSTAVGTRAFALGYPASVPSGFSANGSGSRQVSFSWSKGAEPDLTSYTLYDESGVVQAGIDPSTRCSGGTCTYGIYYSSDRPGSHTYALTASRKAASSSDPDLVSDRTTATATLDSPPPAPAAGPASPSPGASTGGSGSGTTTGSGGTTSGGTTTGSGGTTSGGTTSGGSTPTGTRPAGTTSGGSTSGTTSAGAVPVLSAAVPAAQRRAFALTFHAFAPSLGIPKLPPLPSTSAPQLAGEGPLPQGTFQPTLPYGSTTTTVAEPRGTLSAVSRSVADVIDSAQLARSISVALLLLLVAAHVRRFVGTSTET